MSGLNPPQDGMEARDLLIRGLELIYVRDEPEAGAACIRAAAEYGLPRAQGELGTCYDYGRGVPSDETQALHWYRLAAEQGDAEAMYDLAVLYRDGDHPDRLNQMHHWRQLAAENGHAYAMYWLGNCYKDGEEETCDYTWDEEHGTETTDTWHPWPKDKEKALHWLRLAAAVGIENAQHAIDRIRDEE